MKMVVKQVPQGSKFSVGQRVDLGEADVATLEAAGHSLVTAREHDAELRVQAAEAAEKAARERAVDGAIKASKAFAPKQDTAAVRARALVLEAALPGEGVAYVNSLPELEDGLDDTRVMAEDQRIQFGTEGLRETVKAYFQVSEPFNKELRNGGIVRATKQDPKLMEEAIACSVVRAQVAKKLADMVAAGADFRFSNDMVRAADYADPAANNPLGVLNTGLTLQWNLGFLANQLPMLNDIVTDVSNTPALFNQQVRTRYIQVPKVQLKTATNAWSGGTGTTVDVNVVMDSHAGVPITVNNNYLGATARQLLNEQKQPQLYALGEYIIYKLVNCIFNGSTRIANDGSTTSTIKFNNGGTGQPATFSVGGATLATFTSDLPEAMDEAKFPGGDEDEASSPDLLQRFAWVHGRVYAAAAADTNFVLNQSIQRINGNTDNGNVIETGRFRRLGNLRFRKSQLVTDQCSVSGSGADATTNGIVVSAGTYANATGIGFAGTRNALLFVSRVPTDYTKALPEIPSTAAVELVTEPKTGLTFMVVKYLDHSYETTNMRVQLMFGQAVGDERMGIQLTK